jgi:hypothetical protein
VAKNTVRRCLRLIADVWIDNGTLSGRALDDHHQWLLRIERDLSAAEGELAE